MLNKTHYTLFYITGSDVISFRFQLFFTTAHFLSSRAACQLAFTPLAPTSLSLSPHFFTFQ